MKKLIDFCKNHRYAIVWSVAYFTIIWAVLLFMFGFNMLIWNNWILMANARIHGFAGFVFCLLILAALPMYIATTMIIMNTRKPLITVNITKILTPIIKVVTPHPLEIQKQSETPTPEITEPETQQITEPKFPSNMPTEVRHAFVRARESLGNKIIQHPDAAPTAPATPAQTEKIDTEISDLADIPLPPDFDTEDTEFDLNSYDMSTPVFKDIQFDDNDSVSEAEQTLPVPDITPAAPTPVTEYLIAHGRQAKQYKDLIISGNQIIATHDDPDFWIADPEAWFAAGHQKPSPIIELIKASGTHKCKPVLYLAQTNIMDLDNCCKQWTEMGITVITDLDELPY